MYSNKNIRTQRYYVYYQRKSKWLQILSCLWTYSTNHVSSLVVRARQCCFVAAPHPNGWMTSLPGKQGHGAFLQLASVEATSRGMRSNRGGEREEKAAREKDETPLPVPSSPPPLSLDGLNDAQVQLDWTGDDLWLHLECSESWSKRWPVWKCPPRLPIPLSPNYGFSIRLRSNRRPGECECEWGPAPPLPVLVRLELRFRPTVQTNLASLEMLQEKKKLCVFVQLSGRSFVSRGTERAPLPFWKVILGFVGHSQSDALSMETMGAHFELQCTLIELFNGAFIT